MSKLILYISFLGIFFNLSAQLKKEPASYKQFRKDYKYTKHKKYTGPDRSYTSPVPMEKVDFEYDEDYTGLKYSQRQIEQSRSKRGTTGRGGGTGNKPFDPGVRRNAPVDLNPQAQPQKVNPPSPPMFSPMFWKILLFIILFLLLAWIAFLVVRNYRPKEKPVQGNFSPAEWNPAMIPKTELELRLEAAMERNDYRECVRIYFTFILKELIRLRRIKWKKDLTNIDYLIQLAGKEEYIEFQESVRIYDLVWYGEYEITKAEYEEVVPRLEKNYKSLTAKHE